MCGGDGVKRHRWSDKVAISPNKTECECKNGCGIVKVTRHEWEGGREKHWTEFWRGLDLLGFGQTPACTGAVPTVKYDARNYPL